ncbi:MAG: aminotransferase class IV [Methylocystaceae bacterium]|nr:aminotransferase class IV [Methylocystaceae bacterium]
MIAWFNGELLPLRGVHIQATDRGFLLGDGFFETMAANKGQVIHFDAHMTRLEDTARKLKFPLPYNREELKDAVDKVLLGNQFLKTRTALRLTITRGSGPRGLMPPLELNPQVLLTASEVPDHFPSAKVKTVSICRNEKSPTAQIKSLCYLDNILAMEEAHEHGSDEALMLNSAGHITEGSISNIFFVKNDQLLTPKISDGVLPGIMRNCVLETAHKLGMNIVEDSLEPEIIQTCDEAFLTNSLFRVRPIHELDGRLIPSEVWADKILQEIKAAE